MRTIGWNILVLCFAFLDSAKVPKKCSAPLKYPHTSLDKSFTAEQRFNTGEKVYYKCAEDFTPYAGSRAVQCVDGKWTRLTLKCEKRSCGNAGDLLNGQFHYEGNSFLGDKVYAICNDGYTVKGRNYMICKKSGWTGEFPSCEEGETTCSTPAVANSVKSGGDVSVYQVGDNVTFACSQGFQLDGAQLVTCGPDGQWQPQPPQCLPAPEPTTEQPSKKEIFPAGGCGVPPNTHNSNANLAHKYITMRSFASGDRVHYVCDIGHIQGGGSKYRTCRDGKWTPLFLKCELKQCGSAGEILNGQFMYSGVEFGDTATAVCDEGYSLVGRATRNCMSDGWDGRVPVCEAVVCPEPQKVKNAEMTGLQETPYIYESVVRYQCRVGTLIGQREIWCTKDGTWSAPPPQCKEMTCPSPIVPGAYWRRTPNNQYQYREIIMIRCNPGYTMLGPRAVTCGRDGQWSPGIPRCVRPSYRSHQWSQYAN